MKDIFQLLIAVFIGIPVAIAIFIFKFFKTTLMVIFGIAAVATGQTKESLVNDVIKEKAELDRVKDRASRPETAYDQLEDLTIEMYRNHAKRNDIAPTSKTYDHEILEIVKTVQTAFTEAAEQKGEHILGTYLMTINVYFLHQYENFGKEFFIEHLRYEVNKYLNEGLRDDYQKDLGLI